MQFHWLAAIFGGFDAARVWHFWLMWVFILFVVPHVILVFADGWDTVRSIIVRLVGKSKADGGRGS
jgi:thiosulfate reductase cytochrome b subunit